MKNPSSEAIRRLQRSSQGPILDSRIMDFSTLDPSALVEDWTLASFEPDVASTTTDLPGIAFSYSPITP